MTTSLYRCQIIGSGTDDDPFEPAIASYAGVPWSCVADEREDATKANGTMVIATSADPSVFAGDSRIVPVAS